MTPKLLLALENIALRQQVAVLRRHVARPRLQARDRVFWVILRRPWSGWSEALALVQPATVLRWHRAGWQRVWRWNSRKKSGRPTVPLEVRELIRRLSRLWGAPRIRDELRLLGHHVAKSTVEKYMVRRRGPPSPTWRAFLHEHASEILACDFFTIPTATFRSLTGFVVMELGRRRILACSVTAHPSGSWAAEIVRRAATYEKCRCLMRDRDPVYGGLFSDAARSMGLRQMVSAPRTPVMNVSVRSRPAVGG